MLVKEVMSKITNSNISGAIGARFDVDNDTLTWYIKRVVLFTSTVIYQVAESDIVQFKIIDNRKPFGTSTMSTAYKFRDGNWIVIAYDVSNTTLGKLNLLNIEVLKRRFAHIQESPF